MAFAGVLSGCARQGAAPSAETDDVVALKVLEPKSGGEMVPIPEGTFTMGDASGRADETPHAVSVASFYMDRVPVTQELYEKVMGVNPSKRKDKQNPVERTQWTDAVRFCNKCSEMEGLTPCYDLKTWACDFTADGYRLPTEAEWEYACRAGSAAKYCCGDYDTSLPAYAWYKPHSKGRPQPVGQKRPNNWSLYDMHGNVWQWCNDYYDEKYYADSPKENPRGPATGRERVLRGGAWDCTADKCRAAYRFKEFPVFTDACFGADAYGFRRVRRGVADKPVSGKGTEPATDNNHEGSKPPVSPVQSRGKIEPGKLKGTIVFVSDRGGKLKIWRMLANGKDAVQLTKDDYPEADPRFSPDGKRILYTSLRDGFPEVWVMNRDGAAPKFVTKGSQANWSPNGKSIVFIEDNQGYTRDLSSGQEKRITPDAWERCGVPAWRPDGKSIAVASRHLGTIGIFLVSLDGKDPRQLKTEEACCTPEWSKDGKRLLCQSVQGHVHQVDVDGKNWEQVTFGADMQHDARYSPDASMILFCRAPSTEGPWQICVKRLDSDDDSDFVQITKDGSNLLPDWHPDED
jgi:formylglycine-generating enzyme required for sulfatase activity/Tol biopolymer transport system component